MNLRLQLDQGGSQKLDIVLGVVEVRRDSQATTARGGQDALFLELA